MGLVTAWLAVLASGSDLSNHAWFVGENLVRNFSSMDFHVAWEIHCKADSVAFDGSYSDNADRIGRISNDNFFTFSSRNDEHASDLLPMWSCHLPLRDSSVPTHQRMILAEIRSMPSVIP